ncbi:MAG: preprotein translocase subunit SecG [Lachnospiraceae bacterium]|nr:preprotein translocase subunit SecG [Lachnospiraceae bacterium]
METAVYILYVIVCIALTVVVLLQEGKQGGLTGAISGGAETYWSKNKGRSKEGRLAIATTILAIAFIVLSVVLNLLVKKG